MAVLFRLAEPSDALRMTDFHNQYYGTRRPFEHWLWLYFGLSPERATFAYALSDDGRVIATQGMVPYPLVVDGRVIQTSKSESTLMLPEGRGGGLMADLYEFAFADAVDRGSTVIWGFTDSERAFSRFGFSVQPVAATYDRRGRSVIRGAVGRVHADGAVRQRVLSAGKHLRDSVTRRRPKALQSEGFEGRPLTASQARSAWCALAESSGGSGVNLAGEDGYFDWRWIRNPNAQYEFLGLIDQAEVVAVAVLARVAGRVVVSDIKARNHLHRRAMAVAVVERHQRSTGAFRAFGNSLLEEGPESDGWPELGFHVERVSNLVVRVVDGARRETLDRPECWGFSFAWSEGVGA